jgi:DnaJ-class molecular chaperone
MSDIAKVLSEPCRCVWCSFCHGQGHVRIADWGSPDEYDTETCDECHGHGIVEKCDRCQLLDELSEAAA